MLKAFIAGEQDVTYMVVKTSPKEFGKIMSECQNLKDAREDQKFHKKSVIIKSLFKMV